MKQQTIRRFAGIQLTATGYQVIFVKDFDTQQRTLKTYNISPASMKRFYKVSNKYNDIYEVKRVPYYFFRKMWMK